MTLHLDQSSADSSSSKALCGARQCGHEGRGAEQLAGQHGEVKIVGGKKIRHDSFVSGGGGAWTDDKSPFSITSTNEVLLLLCLQPRSRGCFATSRRAHISRTRSN